MTQNNQEFQEKTPPLEWDDVTTAAKQLVEERKESPTLKSRTEQPGGYPIRFPVPEGYSSWLQSYPEYNPPYYVAEVVLFDPKTKAKPVWADPEDITLINRVITSYEGSINFDGKGHPINPITRTGIVGRGLLGKWGPNFAADPIISRINPNTGVFEIVLIERSDNGEWAIPGGMVDEGEAITQTLEREFEEEAGAQIDMSKAELVYCGYVDDPRNTDNAWMETTAKHLHLDPETALRINLKAGDDAVKYKWAEVNVSNMSNLYASHGLLVKQAITLFLHNDNNNTPPIVRDQLALFI